MEKIFNNIIEESIKKYRFDTIEYRRHIHMNPEIGFDTKETEEYIKKCLCKFGIEILDSGVGVVARIQGKSNRYIALRADIDALPLQEETNASYASRKKNIMHACGHDAHTAILLTTARILSENRDLLNTSILLIFQPAEEGPNLGGARLIVQELKKINVFKDVEGIFGLHVFNNDPTGTIKLRYGGMMASTDEFDIEIIGKAGHAGEPHMAIDAISIVCKIVDGIETWMSRRMNPLDQGVCSIGIIRGGSAKNIIAEVSSISGTIRCLEDETREKIIQAITNISEEFAKAYGAIARINILRGLPPLVNNFEMTKYAEEIITRNLGEYNLVKMENPIMGAEDFAFYINEIPGTFIHIGSGNKKLGFTELAHTPKFDIDEEALFVGIKVLCNLVFQYK
ncbi:M20 family metallopeptidase [Eubacteriales bacterium KG127]